MKINGLLVALALPLMVFGISSLKADQTAISNVSLSEGAFYKIPAGMPHVSKCISDVDCVTFLYQDGQFDFVPVQ